MKILWTLLVAVALLPPGAGLAAPARILILTGENNHDWRATTPVLKTILEADGRFVVDVETNVPAMKPEDFTHYDALLSNFNTYGKKEPGPVWDTKMRAAFADYIRSGRGFVAVHAGSAGFYDWPEFQQIAGATWGPHTEHGGMHTNEIHILATNHPITAPLGDFVTYDEFWQNAQIAPGALALATVTPKTEFGGTGKPESIAFVTKFGQGRGFTLLLGHDTQGMTAPGFKALLCRGAEWAATGTVSPDNHPLK
ncbi:MAG: ThuA domain-containing protein [Limisphaerales bacterium]